MSWFKRLWKNEFLGPVFRWILFSLGFSAVFAFLRYADNSFSTDSLTPILERVFSTGGLAGFLFGMIVEVTLDSPGMKRAMQEDLPAVTIVTVVDCKPGLERINNLVTIAKPYCPDSVKKELDVLVSKFNKTHWLLITEGDASLKRQFLDEIVTPAVTWLVTYAKLREHVTDFTRDALAASEAEMIPLLFAKLDAFYNQLLIPDVARLSIASSTLELATADVADRAGSEVRDWSAG